ITVSGAPRYKRDELTVESTTNFLKAQSCTPVEFLRKYLKYNQYDDGTGYFTASNNYINGVAPKYFEAAGLAQGLVFNLEASTNGKGADAIVSNECLLNFEPFEPYIYYKDADFNYVPLAFTDAPGDTHSQNAVATFNGTLDLNKVFMLRDQMIGTAEKVGFEVAWEYAVPGEAADVLEIEDGVLNLQDGADITQLGGLFYVDVTAKVLTPSNGSYTPVSAGRYYLQVAE
ncbi:MAG: hypothetical protein KBT44_03000, partial [Bacteroidales bacterium]|nr:hypothetical protein [Candidatus Equibacterium intestinale]